MGLMHDLVNATPVALHPAGRVSADANGTAVDISAYDGWGIIVVDATYVSGTATTLDVIIEESDASAGTYTAVPDFTLTQLGATGSTFQVKAIELQQRKKFLRARKDVSASGTPVYDLAVTLIGQKKYQT